MEYKETDDLIEDGDNGDEGGEAEITPDMPEIEEEELEAWPEDLALDELAKKAKTPVRFSLKARRAIEEHVEQRRLRKQLDYFFDEDFVPEEDESSKDNPKK